MKFRSMSLAPVLAAALLAGACTESDPAKPGYWIPKLEQKDTRKVAEAAQKLRKMKAKEAVQPLVALLKHEEMALREEAAYALGEIGDAAAVQPLMDAVDLASKAKGAERANMKIAEALGALGDRKAVPALLRMTDAPWDYVKLSALDALAKLRDPAAVPVLMRLVENESTQPLLTKKAIIALGEMRATEAIPALLRGLVMERQGVSFFLESSYGLFQMGAPAADALQKVLSGEDKPFLKWAEERNRHPAGYLTKAAIVLADLGEKSAIPHLVKLLSWTDATGNEPFEMLVRAHAGEALGRLRAKVAAGPVAAGANLEDANMREKFAYAIAHIGDKSVMPKLVAIAQNGSWSARQAGITGVALLGDGAQKALFEGFSKKEQGDLAFKSCMDEEGSPMEPAEMKKERCERQKTERPKFMTEETARLLAGEECKASVDCWIGKLKHQTAKVRERAAYELGKSGDVKAIDALVAACRDDDRLARRAAYIALDWFTTVPEAKATLQGKADALAKQLEEEKGRAHTVVVNEDLRRVVWKIRHLDAGSAALPK